MIETDNALSRKKGLIAPLYDDNIKLFYIAYLDDKSCNPRAI